MSPIAGITDLGMNALFKFIVPREIGNERPRYRGH
jgi:hypothetical protein